MRDRLDAELSDRYVIERELGRGGMATVWLARDRRHERAVAIKVLHPELAGAIGVDRFAREVRLMARLQHPSIVPVLDSGVLSATDNTPLPWYAMAYIAGESVRARLAREVQLPMEEALRIACGVAAALDVAHQQGIVHRDIKPENIILADGRVYVVDFGIARALLSTGDERLTSTGLALGTPAYMSPEQATAGTVDARADQYSLAAVLYEMLAGEPPVTGPTAQAIIARRMAGPVRPIRPVRSAVPEAVEAAVLKALERVPADRFPDVATFAAELEHCASSPARGAHLGGRFRRVLLAAAVVMAALAAWKVYGRAARPAAPAAPDPELLALYQRGMRGYDQRTTSGAIDAIQSLRAAVMRDSTYAPAWSGLAKIYVQVVGRQFPIPGIGPDSVLRLAVAAVDRALALDSTDADAWAAKAAVTRRIDPTDVSPAIRAARRAIDLDSTNGPAWHFLAISLAELGELDAALEAWRQCVRRNPSYTIGLAFLALGHYWGSRYDSAVVWADSAVAVEPSYLLGRTTLGDIEIERGNFARAIAAFEAARRLTTDVEAVNALAARAVAEARAGRVPEARATLRLVDSLGTIQSVTAVHTAIYAGRAYAALGDVDGAVRWLTRYPVQEDLHYQLHIRCDPPFAAIANDRRYRSLLTMQARAGGC